MRRVYGAIVSSLLVALVLATSMAYAQAAVLFDLPAQPLADSLRAVGHQTHTNVVFDAPLVDGLRAPALKASLTADQAFTRLLVGTPLKHRFLDDQTVTIVLASAPPKAAVPTQEGEKSNSSDSSSDARSTEGLVTLEEVVVTAQKRKELLQDVPVPVTAINAETLLARNEVRLQDYYTEIPGLSVTPDAAGQPTVIIRGLSTGLGVGNPTVGITVDDVPYGSSSVLGAGGDIPDIDPAQLQRVEVLRGPQGTLYGASSLGGLIKFVTADPSTTAAGGRLEAGTSGTYHGDGLGYSVRGSGNLPLGDSWAINASASTRRDPGYIDDPGLHLRGVNRQSSAGGRLALLWAPSPELSLKLSALVERNVENGSPDAYILPGLGDLQHSDLVFGVGGYTDHLQAYSAVLRAKLGSVELTSVSGYNVKDLRDSLDISPVFAVFTQPQFNVAGTAQTIRADDRKVSQEIRLAAPLGSRLDGLLGFFYTHEKIDPFESDILAIDTNSQQAAAYWSQNTGAGTYQEYAAFADLTVHVTERFDVQLGGRESHNQQTYAERDVGPYETVLLGKLSETFLLPEVRTDDNSFTYLLTPRFKVTPNIMVYARVASGYRAGGPNPGCAALSVPCSFKPDRTHNYEIGTKESFLDHRLNVDTSVYYIDWKDIQISEYDQTTFNNYTANAAGARSKGVELSLDGRPSESLKLAGWIAWNRAVLTEAFPDNTSAFGSAGARLPNSPRLSGSVSLEDELHLGDALTAFLGGSLSYVGDRVGPFEGSSVSNAPRQVLPGYATVNFHGGVRMNTWSLNAYVNNAADRRGVLATGPFPYQYNFVRPRTIGISLSRRF